VRSWCEELVQGYFRKDLMQGHAGAEAKYHIKYNIGLNAQGEILIIGVKGFEPSTSRSRTVRSSRAELHPETVNYP
jgi:hypothetical protein